jgi:RNA polymerase sigma-70 factor (ECF subfamily)
LRSWLYTIATNTCLNAIDRRKPRQHPIDYGPRTDPDEAVPGLPVAESVWIEPFPDELLGVEDGPMAPEARYEAREAVELAFIAALQHLPPNQRAVLILREVLGYSARETAATLETSVASVNSALQRARATLEDRLPDRSQQATLRILGDDGVREVVDAYVEAWDREDIDGVVAMLTEEATFSMPPMDSWYGGPGGHPDLRGFLRAGPLTGEWRWRHLLTRANGQYALAFYCWYEPDRTHRPFALNVLSFEGRRISDVTCFINRSIESDDPDAYVHFPNEPLDPRRTEDFFLRFGLPDRID